MLELDHIVVAGASLDAAALHVAQRLQVDPSVGGEHPIFHTHNSLVGLTEGVYLEAIAANPKAPLPERPRWFDLDRFEGPPRLTNWACRTDDLDGMIARFPEAGDILSLSRGDLRWRMAVPRSGILPFDNLFPAFLQWESNARPQTRLPPAGRLDRLTVRHPWAQALKALLDPVLSDDRLFFEEGPAGLDAAFTMPDGVRTL